MSRPISRSILCLPFPESLIKKLGEAGITTYQEVVKLAASIDSVLFLSAEDKTLISTYVEKHSKERMSFHTALDEKNCIQSSWKDISTGCAAIDSILGGGLKWKTITEVCGRGATGKTQLCMLMCATVQRNNTLYSQQKAIFIDTEHTFNASRQKELTDSLHNPYCTLSNIYVFQPQSLPEFLTLIRELPSFLHSHSDVHLLVIDSVTYFFREFTDMLRRHELLTAFVAALTRATLSFPLATLVTNHVTSYALDSPEAVLNPQSVVQPMLGPLWWHATTTQLLLARTPQGTRLLSVKKSPFLERASLSVVIEQGGFQCDE
ncbi:hypothetical protein WA538_005571, partial [Blastocystis sp. DL]